MGFPELDNSISQDHPASPSPLVRLTNEPVAETSKAAGVGSTGGLAVAESYDHPHASRGKRGSRFLNLDYCLSKVVAVRTGEHASSSPLAWGFGNDPAHHVSLPPCCLPPCPSGQLANRKPKDRKPVSAIHTELPSSFISPQITYKPASFII